MKELTYVFTPLVHCPWGEMQLTLVTRATSYFDAQCQVMAELNEWKRSQAHMERHDFPWLDEAIKILGRAEGCGGIIGMFSDKPEKTLVFWYDEREP